MSQDNSVRVGAATKASVNEASRTPGKGRTALRERIDEHVGIEHDRTARQRGARRGKSARSR